MIPPEEQADKIMEEYLLAREGGLTPDIPGIVKAHPALAALLEKKFEALSSLDLGFAKIRGATRPSKILLKMPSEGEVLGDFQIIRELGRGGNGVVYLARQQSLKRLVALKMLRIDGDSKAVERFRREAETIAQLKHERIASVHAFGMLGDFHYLALEYIPGIPLSALISRLRTSANLQSVDGPVVYKDLAGYLDETEADLEISVPPSPGESWSKPFVEICCRLIADIANALAYAHTQGVIHRDIKPSNIIVGLDGHATLIDFGLTKNTEHLALTQSTDFLGTIYYASPEQVDGNAHAISASTDIYSLGATLYELLTWARPFDGTSIAEVARKVIHSYPTSARKINPRIHSDLQVITETCLQKEAKRRYVSAEALKDDIERFLSYQPIHAKPTSLAIRGLYAIRRRPRETAGLAAILLLIGLLSIAMRRTRESDLKVIREHSDGIAKEGSVANNLRLADWAITKFGEAIQADPTNCSAYLERARVFILQKNDIAAANADMLMAQRLPGCDNEKITGLLAQLAFAKKDFTTAIRLERELYSKDRTNVDVATRLATKLTAAGKLGEAKVVLTNTLQMHPTDYILEMSLGMLEDKRKDYGAALRAYEKAHDNLQPTATIAERKAVLFRLGQLYWDRKEFDKAVAIRREEVRAFPNDVISRQGLIVCLMQLKRYGEAEDELKLAVNLDPKNYFHHLGLAIVYASQERFDRAIDEYEKVVALGGRNASTLNSLAMTYERIGNLLKAKSTYESVLVLAPKDQYAIERLRFVDGFLSLMGNAAKRKEILATIKASGGYVDEAKGVGFSPPDGWVRRDNELDSDGITFQDERSPEKIKPQIRFAIEVQTKTPEEYFSSVRDQMMKSGMAEIEDSQSSYGPVGTHSSYISRYLIRSGVMTARVVRYDIRLGKLAYILTCMAPTDLAETMLPLCERAVNTSVLGE